MKKAFISSLILGIVVTAGFSGAYTMPEVVQAAEAVQSNSYIYGKNYEKPIDGYRRYPAVNKNVTYSTTGSTSLVGYGLKPLYAKVSIESGQVKFSFYGDKIVLLDYNFNSRPKGGEISFDGGFTWESLYNDVKGGSSVSPFYSKTFSKKQIRDVIIRYNNTGKNRAITISHIDVDSDGYLLPYRAAEFKNLDVDLGVGQSMSAVSNMVKHSENNSEWDEENGKYIMTGTCTIITEENLEEFLNPNANLGKDMEWSSSNPSVVTVDSNGTIKAVGKGQAKIIAKVKDKDVKSCFTVNSKLISDSGVELNEENSGFITMDGKRYYLYKGKKLINEWEIIEGDYYYFTEDGSVATGLRDIDGKVFCFDSKGKKLTGLQNVNDKVYYFSDDGIMRTGWIDIDDDRFFFNEDGTGANGFVTLEDKKYYFVNGKMTTGFQKIGGKNYCFDDDGEMLTGKLDMGKKTYYFNEDGTGAEGFVTVDGVEYYFNPKNSTMAKGITTIGNKVYGFDEKGLKLSGWYDYCGRKYYFNEDGTAQTTWLNLNGSTYYFDSKGVMLKGIIKIEGEYYNFDNITGEQLFGWINRGGERLYFKADGTMAIGWLDLDGSTYYFDKDGAMKKGFASIYGNTYYFDGNGAMYRDWQCIGEDIYYFGEDGVMVSGNVELDGTKYYFDENGAMKTGLINIEGNTYYLDESGAIQVGWIKVDNSKYYFSKDEKTYGQALKGIVTIDENYYVFDDEGILQTGWKEIDGETYYYTADGQLYSGWNEVDGKLYYFNSKGYITKNKTMIKKENGKITRYILGPEGVAVKQ